MMTWALLLILWPAPEPVFTRVAVEDFIVWPTNPPIYSRRIRDEAAR